MNKLYTFFSKWSFKKDGRLFGAGTSPEADWQIIFISAAILAVAVIGLSAFIFIQVNNGEIFVVKESSHGNEDALDLPLLRETVSYYQERAAEFERIKKTIAPAVDPSL